MSPKDMDAHPGSQRGRSCGGSPRVAGLPAAVITSTGLEGDEAMPEVPLITFVRVSVPVLNSAEDHVEVVKVIVRVRSAQCTVRQVMEETTAEVSACPTQLTRV